MKTYDYSQNNAINAGVPGAGDPRNPNFVAEGDWALFTKLESGVVAPGTIYRIPVAPNCPFRKLYLNVYNDAGTPGAYHYGILRASFNRRTVYTMPMTFVSSGTAPALSGLPTGSFMSISWQTGAGTTVDGIQFGKIGNATYVFVSPLQLYLTADEISWEAVQSVATAGNSGVLLACKSMQASV
jgi:hypothetical protein